MRGSLLVKPWPWNTLPEPTPADWGFGMTVCIAVHSSQNDEFICATDSMISTGEMSADGLAMKYAAIWDTYIAMFSGNDISAISPIIRSVRKQYSSLPQHDVDDVVAAFRSAFANERLKKAEAVVMPPGMTISEFYADGINRLGPELFSRLFNEIENVRLDLQFLVCGFDAGDPVLFTISDPGVETHYDLMGFWAIGSGNNNALGSLFNLKSSVVFKGEAEILYRTLEAKFFAESAAGVGKETTCFKITKNGERGFIRDIDPLRTIWEGSSRRPLPDGVLEAATYALKEGKKSIRKLTRARKKQLGPKKSEAQKSKGQQ